MSINTLHKGDDDDDNNNNNNSCNTVFPRDIVCLRNISINTLRKGDDDNDDDDDDDDDELLKFVTIHPVVMMFC